VAEASERGLARLIRKGNQQNGWRPVAPPPPPYALTPGSLLRRMPDATPLVGHAAARRAMDSIYGAEGISRRAIALRT